MCRVYPISNEQLKESGTEYDSHEQKILQNGSYLGDKWGGKYLKAPDILFTIIDKGKDRLVALGDIAKVRFGIKTGANDFFYLTEDRIAEFEISNDYLRNTVFSFKEIRSIEQKDIDFRYRLFWCPYPKSKITNKNALNYIRWGETQNIMIKQGSNKGKTITGYHNIASCKSRKDWYAFSNEWAPADLIFNSKVGERFGVYHNQHGYFEDKKLYGITPSNGNLSTSVCLMLNSTVTRLMMEILSAELTGAQAIIDITVKVVEELPIMDPEQCLIGSFDTTSFFKREIKSIYDECGIDPKSQIPIEEQEPSPLSDRAELDNIIFDALNLTDEERKDVYRAVCQLVWNRISKAKSV